MSLSANLEKKIEEIEKESDVFIQSRLLSQLIHDENVLIKDIASRLEKKSSYICHVLRLRRIPEILIDGYYSSQISLSHLFVLSRLKDSQKMLEAYEKILAESLSVYKTEELVREILYGVSTEGERILQEEKENFIAKLKAKFKKLTVYFVQTQVKGKLTLEFKGNLSETTKVLRSLMKTIENWQE